MRSQEPESRSQEAQVGTNAWTGAVCFHVSQWQHMIGRDAARSATSVKAAPLRTLVAAILLAPDSSP